MQSYVKQKLGETPEPSSSGTTTKSKAEVPSVPGASKEILATSSVVSATEGERWDPNKQLDKLRRGVIRTARERQERFPMGMPTTSGDRSPPAKILIDEGINP